LQVLYGAAHRFVVLDNRPGVRVEIGLPQESAARGTGQ
jgi:hypothetical protein